MTHSDSHAARARHGGESFRFIHAGDFHLETPPGDFDSLPETLLADVAAAPRKAAAAVFDAAVAENIDFLVLTGDLVAPAAAGPHGVSLLLDGFERLHAADTPVYWAAGLVDDPARLPDALPLPPNVTLLPKQAPVVIPVERGGRVIANIIGRSCDGRRTLSTAGFRTDDDGLFRLGVAHGTADAASLADAGPDYWCLGSAHNRVEHRDADGRPVAAQCGSPQGRSHDEPGPHGYSIVDVDSAGNTRVHHVDTDIVRYQTLKIEPTDWSGNFAGHMAARLARLSSDAGGCHVLVRVEVQDHHRSAFDGGVASRIDADRLMRDLRRSHGGGNPAVYVTDVVIPPTTEYPAAWTEEDTILGDFLRVATGRAANPGGEGTIGLASFADDEHVAPAARPPLLDVPPELASDLIADATAMGVDLLRGDTLPTAPAQQRQTNVTLTGSNA